MSNLPKLRISYSFLIGGAESKALAKQFGHTIQDDDYYYKKTDEYISVWQKYERKILAGLQDALGVRFNLAIIDAYGAPFFIPKSAPLLFNYVDEPDRFIDVLTHELCHIALTDNNKYSSFGTDFDQLIGHKWQKMYDLDDFGAVIHVPVHALCKYIWLDVLEQPERYERDKKAVVSWVGGKSYVKSWEYVDRHDYKQILDDLKKLYNEVSQ